MNALDSTPHVRQLARDAATGRIGETMPHPVPAHLCDRRSPFAMRLRPVGGGLEWTTRSGYLVDAEGRCLRCRDTHTVVVNIPAADGFISDERPCPACTVTP